MNKRFFTIILLFSFISQADIQLPTIKEAGISVKEVDTKKAPASTSNKPMEIRVVEGKRIVAETAEGKDIESRLMQVRNKLDGELKKIDQEIEKDFADWQGKARLKVDQESLEKDQAKIMRKKKDRDSKAEAAQEDFTRAFNRELAKFNNQIKKTVTEVAEKENWDMVQIKETGEIIYTSKRIDATDEIIRKHDTKYKEAKKVAKPQMPVLPKIEE